jgi:hypothetical protein
VNLLLRRDTIQSRMQLCLLYSGASVAGFLGVSTSLVKPYGERGGDSRPWFLSRKFTLYQRYILPYQRPLLPYPLSSFRRKPESRGCRSRNPGVAGAGIQLFQYVTGALDPGVRPRIQAFRGRLGDDKKAIFSHVLPRTGTCPAGSSPEGRFSSGVHRCRVSHEKPEIVLVILRHIYNNEGHTDSRGKADRAGRNNVATVRTLSRCFNSRIKI